VARQAVPTSQPARRRRPARPRRFRRYYRSAAWLVFGLGIGGFFVAGVAIDRLGAWDHELPLQVDTVLSFPRSEERWIWLPENHMGDIVCTGTDGGGANLPMRPALGYDHDDFASAFRFPTGDGSVTLRCDAAPSPATTGWTPTGETVRVAEPVDRSRDVPFLQAAFIVTLGGPAFGVVLFVGTLLAQIVNGVASVVAKLRRRRADRRQSELEALRRTLEG